ncbi:MULTISPECIES: hypothetical protein [unclassified Streptomyces]|uniref:hypothetical protein n=1 Tax=unclassified Streptomyces TaxID=2593676 RepID=UPI00278BAE1C|nr:MULTISPECIES: hypothetical protein [unclassified Streptomyces]
MTDTTTTPTLAELTELAVRYAFEEDKARLAGVVGDNCRQLLEKSDAAQNAAMAAGASFTDIHRQANERLIEEIRNRWTPGYIGTLAIDGDLDHPENSLGEIVDLTETAVKTATPNVEALREHAIALGVEANKAHRAGAHTAPVVAMAFAAIDEAQRVGGFNTDLHDQIDIRYATYLLNIHTPGFEETVAFDGDLLHPENAFGEKVDLTGVAA